MLQAFTKASQGYIQGRKKTLLLFFQLTIKADGGVLPCGLAEVGGLRAGILGGLDALPCCTAGIREQVSIGIIDTPIL